MPFVNIRILKGHPQERKDEIARRVTETICEVAKLPKEAVWVVFEDVTADDWYVGQSRVSELQKKAAQSGAKSWGGSRSATSGSRAWWAVRASSTDWPPAASSRKGRCGTGARTIFSSATCRATTCAAGAKRTG